MTGYEKSNAITEVQPIVNKRVKLAYKLLLNGGENYRDREVSVKALLEFLCNNYNIPLCSVMVLNECQPHRTNKTGNLLSKTYGTYNVGRKRIILYNLTAKQKKAVAIKTFINTVLHEFCHHYDHCYLNLSESLHTAGFYRRIGDLESRLQ